VRAAGAYRRACEAGEPFGCGKWAAAIEAGDVPAPEADEDDPAAAAALTPEAIRARACDAGAWDACEQLAESVREGGSVLGRDFGVWLTAACAHGSGRACVRMAGEMRYDDARSALFLRGGCDARDAGSCGKLAQRHVEGKGVPPSARRAAELLARLCSAGDRESCRAASRLVARGSGDLAGSARESFALLERACGLGDRTACEETATGFRPAVAR
jgi:TPR repeat protein